jgi:hypothetical protein
MGWVNGAIEKLLVGESVSIRPHGGSMRPKIESGQLVLLQPIADPDLLEPGDVVLARVAGNVYLHLVMAVDRERVLIGNNRGGINGWTGKKKVYGIAVEVDGKPLR